MKNGRTKYILRFAAVCCGFGFILAAIGISSGAETQMDFQRNGWGVTMRPWGTSFYSNNNGGFSIGSHGIFGNNHGNLYHGNLHHGNNNNNNNNSASISSNVRTEQSSALEPFTAVSANALSEDIIIKYGEEYYISILNDRQKLVEYSVDGQTLNISHKGAPNGIRQENLQIIISVPEDTKLDKCNINTISGDIYMDIKAADLSLNSTSGDISATQSCDKLEAITVSGDVSLLANADACKIRTTSGDIEAETKLKSGSFNSISGEIDLALAGAKSDYTMICTTVSGEIKIDGDKFKKYAAIGTGTNKITIGTTSGEIDVAMK